MPRKAKSDTPKNPLYVAIGKNIKTFRVAKGMTQNDLAKAIGLKDAMSICRWETGTRMIPPDRMAQLAEIFQVDIKDLYDDAATDKPNTFAHYLAANSARQFRDVDVSYEGAEQALSHARNIVLQAAISLTDSQLDVMIAKCNELLSGLHGMKKERTYASQRVIGV